MSQCNFCALENMKRDKPTAKFTTKQGTGEWVGWIVVYKDGKPADCYFKELPRECVC